jgi:23S rRNA pseudouridine1911/1915/1917 synthase
VITAPRVIFQDNDLFVIDKPAGWVVNRSQTTFSRQTLQDWLEKRLKFTVNKKSDFYHRSGLVHRLDKETSGLLLVAKNEKSFLNLQYQFKNRLVHKKYLVLLHGRIVPAKGNIQAPVSRNPFDSHKFGVFLAGRQAVTAYRLRRFYSLPQRGDFSLVEAEPQTGRTHQIRVHFKYLGWSLVGDALYAGRKTVRFDRGWCPRQFLHASYLEFNHPSSLKRLVFKSPLPADLQQALNFIK